MVKRFIWISLVVLLFSCSSRKTSTSVQSEENRSKIEQNITSESKVHIKRSEVETEKKEVSKINLSIKNNPESKPTPSNDCSNIRNVTYRDKDGNETIIPINENSEINLNSETIAETKLKQTQEELTKQTEINENLKKENEELKKTKTKDSERSGISFGSLIFIILCSAVGGVVIWKILEKYWKI